MSPKITAHGGPSHAGHDQPKSYGAMLAAARAGEELSTPEPAVVAFGPVAGTQPVDVELPADDVPADDGLGDSTPYIVPADDPGPDVAEVPKKRAPRKVQGTASAVLEGPVT